MLKYLLNMKNYIKPIIEMIETHTTLLSGSGSASAGGFEYGGSSQSDGNVVTKGDPTHAPEDEL